MYGRSWSGKWSMGLSTEEKPVTGAARFLKFKLQKQVTIVWWKDCQCIWRTCGTCQCFITNKARTANIWPFRWSRFSSVNKTKNPKIYNRRSACGQAGAKYVVEHLYTFCDICCESNAPTRPGGCTVIKDWKTWPLTDNSCSHIPQRYSSCETFPSCAVSLTVCALYSLAVGCRAGYFC